METLKMKISKALIQKNSKEIIEAFYKIGILPIAIDYDNFYEVYLYKFKVEKDLIRSYGLTCDNDGCFLANIQISLVEIPKTFILSTGDTYTEKPRYEYTLVKV